jgi:hypothetical protein
MYFQRISKHKYKNKGIRKARPPCDATSWTMTKSDVNASHIVGGLGTVRLGFPNYETTIYPGQSARI